MARIARILFILLAAGAVLLIVVAVGGYSYTQYLVTHPPVPEPAKPLLSWKQPLPPKPESLADWEQVARADQAAQLDLEQFIEPSLEYAPWTRWWWPGNVVAKDELLRELNVFAKQGFGGVEIQPISAGLSERDMQDTRWLSDGWDSPAFYANVRAVLEAASTLGLRVDITAGSGWPSGGPHVGLGDGMQQLAHSEKIVRGPRFVELALPKPQMPTHWRAMGWISALFAWGGFPREQANLLSVVAAEVTDNQRSINPFNIQDQVTLNPDSLQVLDSKVDEDGNLQWQAPQGEWAIIALYSLPGAETGGAALPQPTYVIDHFDAERIQAHYDYLFRDETGLKSYAGKPLRAFFNDSFEFKEERLWPRNHLERFQQKFQYDPRPLLPALVQTGHDFAPFHWFRVSAEHEYILGEKGRRFEEDWEQSVSDAFVEQMLITSRNWGERYHLASRTQAYGFELDLIKAAGSTSIPETEQQGGSMLFMKMPSSGALLYDRPIVTAESFIHKNRAWLSTPAKVKAQAQQLVAAGVNQIIYHGSPYQIQNPTARAYGEDGWYPFASYLAFSEDFSEQHPHWESLQEVNRFIARQQYLMRLGKPETDVLVYYPWLGFPLEGIGEDAFLIAGQFDGEPQVSNTVSIPLPLPANHVDERELWLSSLFPALKELERRGLTWQWVNPEKAAQLTLINGELAIQQQRFHAILLHDIESLPADIARNFSELAANGANVIVSGSVPSRQTGLNNAAIGDQRVRKAFATAQKHFLSMETLPGGPVQYDADNIQQVRRRLANGDRLIFLNNTEKKNRSLTLSAELDTHYVSVLDAWSGDTWPLTVQNGQMNIDLPAYSARTLYIGDRALPDTRAREKQYLSKAVKVDSMPVNDWTLAVGQSKFTVQTLVDWQAVAELADSSMPGTYSNSFSIQKVEGNRYLLELGDVFGTASVKVNGKSVGKLITFPFSVDITDYLVNEANSLEIHLVPPRRNAKVKQLEEQSGFSFGSTERTAAGMLGPVRVSTWEHH